MPRLIDKTKRRRRDSSDERRRPTRVRNLNLRRNLPPGVIECNGRLVDNRWRSSFGPIEECKVTAYFGKLHKALTTIILNHGADTTVVGCVAWLSSPQIIHALSQCKRVLLVVNGENFSQWGAGRTSELYTSLPWFDEPLWSAFADVGTPLAALESDCRRADESSGYAPVRVLGSNGGNGGALMHSKYLVFFDRATGRQPVSVWTGSMNFTKRSGCNVENAVFLEDEELARAYLDDFAQTFCASESL